MCSQDRQIDSAWFWEGCVIWAILLFFFVSSVRQHTMENPKITIQIIFADTKHLIDMQKIALNFLNIYFLVGQHLKYSSFEYVSLNFIDNMTFKDIWTEMKVLGRSHQSMQGKNLQKSSNYSQRLWYESGKLCAIKICLHDVRIIQHSM